MRQRFYWAVCVVSISPLSEARADYVEVTRTANVYAQPDRTSELLVRYDQPSISRGAYLTVATSERTNGYFSVVTSTGERGWIYKTLVRHFPGPTPGGTPGRGTTFYGGMPKYGGVDDIVIHVENAGYTAAYSETKLNPLWVAYRVPATQRTDACPRLRRFLTDDRTTSKVNHNDYTGAGYDRGHMAPSATIGSAYGCDAQNETYFMTNITPQLPGVNQRPWAAFEDVVSDEYAPRFGGVWVITGPVFDRDTVETLCSGVEVPVAFYTIVVREVDHRPEALAVVMTQDTAPGTPIGKLVVPIDDVESRTDLDFFSSLPDNVENAMERAVPTDVTAWDLTKPLDTSFDGTSRTPCVNERQARSEVDFDQ